MATSIPTYQGGDEIVLTPYLQGIGNILIANQERALQEQQAERQRADRIYQDISKEAAKVNPDGLRSADYDVFLESYQSQIKQPMIDAMLARQNGDMKAYAQKMAEVNAGIGTVNSLISRSKQEAKFEYDLAEDIRRNPDRYSDSSTELYRKRISTPINSLTDDLRQGSNAWMRQVDTSKVQSDVDKILDDLYKTSGKLAGVNRQRTTLGGRGADIVQFEEAVDKDAFAESLRLRFASDPAFKAFAQQNNLGATPEEAAINLTAIYEEQGRFNRLEGRQIVRDQAPSQRSGGSGSGEVVGEVTLNVPVQLGESAANATRRVGTNISNVLLPPTNAVNAATGEVVNLKEAVIDRGFTTGKIVSVQEVPELRGILNEAEVAEVQVPVPNPQYQLLGPQAAAAMGVPQYTVERYYIGQDVIPTEGTNAKAIGSALNKLRSGQGRESTSARSTSSNQNNSVPLTDNRRRGILD